MDSFLAPGVGLQSEDGKRRPILPAALVIGLGDDMRSTAFRNARQPLAVRRVAWLRGVLRVLAGLVRASLGGGMAADFNAPRAGWVFILEELQAGFTP